MDMVTKEECDRWKARAEALEKAIRESLSPCLSCIHNETKELGKCKFAVYNGGIMDCSHWEFAESRFVVSPE